MNAQKNITASSAMAGGIELSDIEKSFISEHPAHLVCNKDTELVLEGYPRSGNTVSYDVIAVLCGASGMPKIAHHTHWVQNLSLGVKYKIPCVALLRHPEDAILSYYLYSRKDIDFCKYRYKLFYNGVLQLPSVVVETFDNVINDFNGFLTRLNARLDKKIPLSKDLDGDIERAHRRTRDRAAQLYGAEMARKIAVPTEEREVMKRAKRSEVAAALAADPDVMATYEKVLVRAVR